MSKRECTEAEFAMAEAGLALARRFKRENMGGDLSFDESQELMKAAVHLEAERKPPVEVFIEEVRAILCRCHPDGPPQHSYCASEVAVKDVFARLAKLDAARKEKP